MRSHVVGAAKRIASAGGCALHRFGGRRAAPGFGILLYHRVAPLVPGTPAPTWNVTPERFRSQIEGLLSAGYRIWPLRRLIDCVESGRAVPEKVTAITFDDGYQNNYLRAWPVLDDLSVPATIFVATAFIGSTTPFPFDEWGSQWHAEAPSECWRPLKWGECRAMEASGVVEIGSHTHTHRDLRGDVAGLRAEVERSVLEIDDHLGPRASLFAFPYGAPEVGFATVEDRHAVQATGVRCALTTQGSLVRRGESPFEWGRFEVTSTDTGATLEAKLAGWYDWVSSAKRWFVRFSPPPYLHAPSSAQARPSQPGPHSLPSASSPATAEDRSVM